MFGGNSDPHGDEEVKKMSLRRYALRSDTRKFREQTGAGSSGTASDSTNQVHEGCELTPDVLQDAIQERMVEAKRDANEKRSEGLRRIADMRSRSGIHPLTLFPNEIWKNIVDELNCPKDRASISEVHVTFRDLLGDTRLQRILFPLALDYKIPLNLDWEDMKSLRQVCTSLRNAIDRWIVDCILFEMTVVKRKTPAVPVPCFNLTENQDYQEWINRGRPKTYFQRALQVEFTKPRFLYRRGCLKSCGHLTEASTANKRKLKSCTDSFHAKITRFLKAVGPQILFFRVSFEFLNDLDSYGFTIQKIYKFLRDCLLLLPNLKWLQVSGTGLGSLIRHEDWVADARRGLQRYPIPRLNQLERVDLTMLSAVHNPFQAFMIWDPILIANPQVKYHTFEGDLSQYERLADPSVLSLALDTAFIGNRERKSELPSLQRIRGNMWNLKRLTLMINCMNEDDGLNTVFRSLQTFITLQELTLGVNNVKFGATPLNFIMLPNLLKLKVEIGPVVKFTKENRGVLEFFSLQFLFHSAKLEFLIWYNLHADSAKLRRELDSPDSDDLGILMNFQGGLVDLECSNIWNVFPKLRCIKVKYREGVNKERNFYSREYCNGKLVHENNDKWSINSL